MSKVLVKIRVLKDGLEQTVSFTVEVPEGVAATSFAMHRALAECRKLEASGALILDVAVEGL